MKYFVLSVILFFALLTFDASDSYSQTDGGSAFPESFESVTFPPPGWSKLNPDGGPGWNRQTVGTSPLPGWTGGVITAPPGGENAVAFCTWNTGGSSDNDQWLYTPQISGIQILSLKRFDQRREGICPKFYQFLCSMFALGQISKPGNQFFRLTLPGTCEPVHVDILQ
jgi:hypothetical protein